MKCTIYTRFAAPTVRVDRAFGTRGARQLGKHWYKQEPFFFRFSGAVLNVATLFLPCFFSSILSLFLEFSRNFRNEQLQFLHTEIVFDKKTNKQTIFRHSLRRFRFPGTPVFPFFWCTDQNYLFEN